MIYHHLLEAIKRLSELQQPAEESTADCFASASATTRILGSCMKVLLEGLEEVVSVTFAVA